MLVSNRLLAQTLLSLFIQEYAMANVNTNAQENTALTLYLRDIEKIPLITREEEYDLALKAKAGDSWARERLVNGNLRFVVSIAKQYQNRGLPLV